MKKLLLLQLFSVALLTISTDMVYSAVLSIKDNVIYCGECELVKLTNLEVRYTLLTEDLRKIPRGSMCPYSEHHPVFEVSENGYFEKETQSSMDVRKTKDGIEINVKSPLNTFSEYGVCLPFNYMGKAKSGGWKKQYLLNNVFRSTDGQILYAYLTSPSGNNVGVVAKNKLAGWKEDYYNGHFFNKFSLYANLDQVYAPKEQANEVSFIIFPVNNYEELLDKVSGILQIPFLDVDKSGGKIGDKIKLISHGKTDSVKIVNEFTKTEKTIAYKDEIEIEYESDTYLYPIRYKNGKKIVGGEAEIYGYRDIIDTYKKTMNKVNLFRVFHRKNNEFDGNVCEHQCWMSAGLRFLMKYGDKMNAGEKKILEDKLKCILGVLTETDPAMAIPGVTILKTPQGKLPPYNVVGRDRIQENAFAMTIFLDAYKYFGDQLYYDYLINMMDNFLGTYQKENGALVKFNGEDYSTVCCLIIPIIDVAKFLEDKDKLRSDRYKECAKKLAWHICDRGLDFPTEGGATHDPDEKEMEDGSIACSALSLLYYCNNLEYIPEFITKAKEILDIHETWVMQSSSCGSKCSSLRWWETIWEGDQNGSAICAGHAWTIWRAEADWLYYKLSGDKKYYIKSYNGFMTNISKIRPDGSTYAIRNIDMIPEGGFDLKIQKKFPSIADSGLSRYVWIRANDSILDSLICQ